MGTLQQMDGELLISIQSVFIHGWLTPVMKFITSLGNSGIIWIALTVIMLLIKRTRPVGVMMMFALLGALLVDNIILKNLVARTRPYDAVEGVRLLIERQNDYSFPSGHTGSSFAAAVVMFRELPRKWGVSALVLAFLIAFSRLYVGVHYPTDVLAGLVIGTVLALLSCWLCRKYIFKDPAKLAAVKAR